MKGKFTFSDRILSAIFCLIGIIISAIILSYGQVMLSFGYYIAAAIVFMATMWVTIALCYIPGRYSANNKGVTFRILFCTYRFAYGNIISVKTENCYGGHSRYSDTYSIETRITIHTADGTYKFRAVSNSISMNEQIKNPGSFEKQLEKLEFVQLGKFIESKVNGHD